MYFADYKVPWKKILEQDITSLGEPTGVSIKDPSGKEVFSGDTEEADIRYPYVGQEIEAEGTYTIVLQFLRLMGRNSNSQLVCFIL